MPNLYFQIIINEIKSRFLQQQKKYNNLNKFWRWFLNPSTSKIQGVPLQSIF